MPRACIQLRHTFVCNLARALLLAFTCAWFTEKKKSACLQGLHSSSPSIASFSQQALLSLEGLIHPRAGVTVLQSDRQHPYHQAGQGADVDTELGMPRLWSALIPESYIIQQPASATPVISEQQPEQSAAAASAAQQVLAAGQLYSQAIQKLDAALKGGSQNAVEHGVGLIAEAGASPPAETQPSSALLPEQQIVGEDSVDNAVLQELSALPLAQHGEATSMDMTANEPDQHTVTAPARQEVEASFSKSLQNGLSSVHQDAQGGSEAEADDGYISLMSNAQVALPKGKLLQADADNIIGLLAGADSSDSQGTLPDIDSGESDSNVGVSD